MRRAPRPGPRTGAVLVFVVLLMLALLGLGHGLLLMARAEQAASSAALGHVVARSAAQAGVQAVLSAPRGAWIDSVPIGGVYTVWSGSLNRAAAVGSARRLGGESWLALGDGTAGRASARVGRLAWAMDPLARTAALEGVVTVAPGAPAVVDGVVDAAAPAIAAPPLAAADCSAWIADLTTRYAAQPLAPVATARDSTAAARLGLLGLPDILRDARAEEIIADAVGTPGPIERFGACVPGQPWGWGDPDRPGGPCGGDLVLRAALHDLTVVGGTGQGLLFVDGDLTLTGGARFHGLVVAKGLLRVEDRSEFVGLALAAGGLHVARDARATGSGCWAARVLAARRDRLARLLPVPGVPEIGPL